MTLGEAQLVDAAGSSGFTESWTDSTRVRRF